jgi:hypothetical protein
MPGPCKTLSSKRLHETVILPRTRPARFVIIYRLARRIDLEEDYRVEGLRKLEDREVSTAPPALRHAQPACAQGCEVDRDIERGGDHGCRGNDRRRGSAGRKSHEVRLRRACRRLRGGSACTGRLAGIVCIVDCPRHLLRPSAAEGPLERSHRRIGREGQDARAISRRRMARPGHGRPRPDAAPRPGAAWERRQEGVLGEPARGFACAAVGLDRPW